MKLKLWLEETDIRQADFARMLGISQPTVSQLANGARYPKMELALKIRDVTKGKVKLEDWIKEDA